METGKYSDQLSKLDSTCCLQENIFNINQTNFFRLKQKIADFEDSGGDLETVLGHSKKSNKNKCQSEKCYKNQQSVESPLTQVALTKFEVDMAKESAQAFRLIREYMIQTDTWK